MKTEWGKNGERGREREREPINRVRDGALKGFRKQHGLEMTIGKNDT